MPEVPIKWDAAQPQAAGEVAAFIERANAHEARRMLDKLEVSDGRCD